MLNAVYSTGVPLLFNIMPEHTDMFVPTTNEFKNDLAVEIGLTYLQTFSSSHCQFLIIAEAETYQVLLQLAKLHSSLLCLRS